jgi:hypothetical protein
MASPLDGKAERAIQPGQLIDAQALCLTLTETHPGHGLAVLYFIIQRHGISPQMDASR